MISPALRDATTDTRKDVRYDIEAFGRTLDALVAAGYNAGGIIYVKPLAAEKLGLIDGPTWRRGIKYYISIGEPPDDKTVEMLMRAGVVEGSVLSLDALYADCAKGGTA